MSVSMAAGQLADFRRCSTAEEYFILLDVDYDPRVLAVNRLHILRYFANQLVELHDTRTEAGNPVELLREYRAALIRSYEAFPTASALDHRLFKVLQDRAPQSSFVPASSITVERLTPTVPQPSAPSDPVEPSQSAWPHHAAASADYLGGTR